MIHPTHEDKNGHRVDAEGRLVFDERCHGCDAPKPVFPTLKDFIEAKEQALENELRGTGRFNPDEPIYGEENKRYIKEHQTWLQATILETANLVREKGNVEEREFPILGAHSYDDSMKERENFGYNAATEDNKRQLDEFFGEYRV